MAIATCPKGGKAIVRACLRIARARIRQGFPSRRRDISTLKHRDAFQLRPYVLRHLLQIDQIQPPQPASILQQQHQPGQIAR